MSAAKAKKKAVSKTLSKQGAKKISKQGAKTTAKKSKKPVAKPPVANLPAAPDEATTIAAYERRLPDTASVAAGDVVPMHASPLVALQHAEAALAALTPHKAEIEAAPKCDWKKASVATDYALALVLAASQVSPDVSTGELSSDLHRAEALRHTLLTNADALVLAGFLPPTPVAAIHSHRGGIAHASDLGALAHMFKSNAKKLSGKTSVTAAQLKEAEILSTTLASTLHPRSGKKGHKDSAERTTAIDVRDRFWTLLNESYAELWRAAAYLFGEEGAREAVPALGGVARGHRKKAAAAGGGSGAAPVGSGAVAAK